jgi:DNA-binding transcriptional LysR family regulator
MLHVHAAYSDRIVDLVGEGLDAGVRMGQLADSNVAAQRICAIRGKLVASPGTSRRTEHPRRPTICCTTKP